MRVLTRNELKYAASLVMTNPDTIYPVENLYAQFKNQRAQSSTASTTITATWTSPIVVDCMFFGKHNANSIVVNLYNDVDVLIFTETLFEPVQDCRIYFSVLDNVARMTVTLNAFDAAYLGSLSLGKYYQMKNITAGYTTEYIDTSIFEQSPGGQTAQQAGVLLRSFSIACAKINATERNAFIAAYMEVLRGGTFWLDQYEDLSCADEPPLFGLFISNILETKLNGLYDLSTKFSEAY